MWLTDGGGIVILRGEKSRVGETLHPCPNVVKHREQEMLTPIAYSNFFNYGFTREVTGMTQHILEGTPQELASYLAQRPHGRFRLVELSEETEAPTQSAPPLPDPQNASSIALLKSWLEEDATDDPEEIRAAEEDLREFKRNMNLPRKEAGARLLYPEVEEA
jgi:hypothetical protein